MTIQVITLTYPDDAHVECVIAPEVRQLKEAMQRLGIEWDRKVTHQSSDRSDSQAGSP